MEYQSGSPPPGRAPAGADGRARSEKSRHQVTAPTDLHLRMTGRSPRGYRAPVYNVTQGVVHRLIYRGFVYNSSLMADDMPYVMRTEAGEVMEIPVHWCTDDWPPFAHYEEIGYLMPVRGRRTG